MGWREGEGDSAAAAWLRLARRAALACAISLRPAQGEARTCE